MTSCKNCIHVDACIDSVINYVGLKGDTPINALEREVGDYPCCKFKDRSRFVELPCKVGDILYHPVPLRNVISEYKIKSFQIYPHCVWVNWNIVDGIATINLTGIYANEIGETVFLTREEAKRALEEIHE